jgi:hypothetical protein
MSFNMTLACGCVVYVSRHPATHVAHTRVIESRGRLCRVFRHDVGIRLEHAEILAAPVDRTAVPRTRPHRDVRGTR